LPHSTFNRRNCGALPHLAARCHADALIGRARNGSLNNRKGRGVKYHSVFGLAAVAATLAWPLAAQAQGIPDGVAHGGYVGMNTAGPIGAVVGGAVGGVVGGVEGLFGIGPVYAAYDEGPARVYHRRHGVRHSYRHIHHKPATG
jgi:hypothetical protein